MRRQNLSRWAALALIALLQPLGPQLLAVDPPDRVNYQAVLRDSAGQPVDGALDVVFRFFASETGGQAILVDSHLAAGTGAVTASGGLLSVVLGDGQVVDGPGSGNYTTLSRVFGDFSEVWVELEIAGETLAPRVRVEAAPFSLNASALDGFSSNSFLRSNTSDTFTSGTLTTNPGTTLRVAGNLRVSSGSPGDGKVLVSDASGNATWGEAPGATTLGRLAGRLRGADPETIPFAQLYAMDCPNQPATLELDIGGAAVQGRPIGFVGHESVSAISDYLVLVESETPLTDGVDDEAELRLLYRGQTWTAKGVITEIGPAAFEEARVTSVVRIRSKAIRLDGGTSLRTFQDVRISDVFQQLAAEAGLSSTFNLAGTDPTTDFIQYGETNLDFLRRIATTFGVHFVDGSNGDLIRFGDADASFVDVGAYLYDGDQPDPEDGAARIATFDERRQRSKETFRVGQFDFTSFTTRVRSDDVGEIPGESAGEREGTVDGVASDNLPTGSLQRAASAAAARAAGERTYHGTSNVPELQAGRKFAFDEESLGVSGDYIVVDVLQFGALDDGGCLRFGNAFDAVVAGPGLRYLPSPDVPRPPVRGLTTGIVTDISGALGQVKVTFRNDLDRISESLWLRVAFPVGQNGKLGNPDGSVDWFGGRFLPEIDDEVLVGFIDDDPRNAVVLGALYNGDDPPPSGAPVYATDLFLKSDVAGLDTEPHSIFFQSGGDMQEFLTWAGNRFELSDNLNVDGELNVNTDGAFGGGLSVNGNGTIGSGLVVGGNTRTTTLTVDANATVAGNVGSGTFSGTLANINQYVGSLLNVTTIQGTNLFIAGAKNFVQNHPDDPRHSVVYTALEGDEVGTYTRGSARLVDGEARIPLSETFALVTHPEVGLTAQITPRQPARGLYVAEIGTDAIVVRSDDPASADVAFDYQVNGLRIGYEEFPVVQAREMDAPLPPAGKVASMAAVDVPAAGARFVRAADALGRTVDLNAPAAGALRAAIGQREPIPVVPPTGPASDLAEEAVVAPVEITSTDTAESGRAQADAAGVVLAPQESPLSPPSNASALPITSQAVDTPGPRTLLPVSEVVAAGDVIALDPEGKGESRRCRTAADAAVVGVVVEFLTWVDDAVVDTGAGDEGTVGNVGLADAVATSIGEAAIATSGVVEVKVDAGFGAIRPGDLLTASPTPGHAMRASAAAPGTILGKALQPIDSGVGTIRMLVTPR